MKRATYLVAGLFVIGLAALGAGEDAKRDARGTKESSALTAKLNDTGIRLAAATRKKDANLVFYPVSVSPVLSAIGNGASGTNLAEIKRATGWAGFDRSDELAAIFRAPSREGFSLKSANTLWSKLSLEERWREKAQRETGANIVAIERQTKDELSRDVNAWFKEKTDGEITDMVLPRDFDLVRFVVVNATSIKGSWETPFTKATKGEFTKLDDTKVSVPLMRVRANFANFRLGEIATCVLLPAKGKAVFGAVLPDKGKFDEAFGLINQALLDSVKDEIAQAKTPVLVTLPKVTLRPPQMDLIPPLQKLGIKKAFKGSGTDGEAAFLRITREDIYIEKFAQKATFELNELGFKGSAGTVAIGVGRSLSASVTLDRPFHFFVLDLETGQLLVIGSLVDPTR